MASPLYVIPLSREAVKIEKIYILRKCRGYYFSLRLTAADGYKSSPDPAYRTPPASDCSVQPPRPPASLRQRRQTEFQRRTSRTSAPFRNSRDWKPAPRLAAIPHLSVAPAAEQFIQRNVASDIFMAPRQFTRRHDPMPQRAYNPSAYPSVENHSGCFNARSRLPRLNVWLNGSGCTGLPMSLSCSYVHIRRNRYVRPARDDALSAP